MKAKKEDPMKIAAEIVERMNVEIFINDRGKTGISYDVRTYDTTKQEMKTDRVTIKEIRKIDVIAYRGDRGDEILFFVKIFISGLSDYPEYDCEFFKIVKDVQEAFAIKDLLEDMISAFEETKKFQEAI